MVMSMNDSKWAIMVRSEIPKRCREFKWRCEGICIHVNAYLKMLKLCEFVQRNAVRMRDNFLSSIYKHGVKYE